MHNPDLPFIQILSWNLVKFRWPDSKFGFFCFEIGRDYFIKSAILIERFRFFSGFFRFFLTFIQILCQIKGAGLHNLLCPHIQKSFKTNMAQWLHRGLIWVHEYKRGGIWAVARGRMKKQWVDWRDELLSIPVAMVLCFVHNFV